MRPVTCPSCGAPADQLLAIQRMHGEQQFLVRVEDGLAVLVPVDYFTAGPIGPVELICDLCQHQWATRRVLPVRMDLICER